MPTFPSEVLTPTEIDWANPSTQGIVRAFSGRSGNDAATGETPTTVGTVTFGNETANFNNGHLEYADPLPVLDQFTVIFRVRRNSTAVTSGIFGDKNSGNWTNTQGLSINLRSDTARILFKVGETEIKLTPSSQYLHNTTDFFNVACVYAVGQPIRIYINGVEPAYDGGPTTGVAYIKSTDHLRIGNYYDDRRPFNGEMAYCVMLDRALTLAECNAFHADPYQLFRTSEDELRDYGLKLTTASETLTLPMVGAYSVDIYYADGTSDLAQTGTGSRVIDGTTVKHITRIVGNDSEGDVYYDCNQANSQSYVPELIQGKHGTLVGFPAPSGYVRDANSNAIVGYAFMGANAHASLGSALVIGENTGDYVEFDLRAEIYENGDIVVAGVTSSYTDMVRLDPEGFFLRAGNGSHARLSDPAYIQPSIGQRFTAKVVRTATGYDVFLDDTPVGSLSASTNLTIQHLSRIVSVYSENTFFYVKASTNGGISVTNHWDFTIDDTDQIIDTVGGNHATIQSAPTSGFLPVLKKQSFTLVGANADYVDTQAFDDGTALLSTDILEAIYLGVDTTTTSVFMNTQPATTYIFTTTPDRFFDGQTSTQVGRPSGDIYNYGKDVVVKGVALSLRAITNGASINFENAHLTNLYTDTSDQVISIKNTVIGSFSVVGATSSVSIVDSITNSRLNVGTSSNAVALSYTNSISTNSNAFSIGSACPTPDINNSVFTDASIETHNGGGNQFSVDLTGAFVDQASGDYRIPSSWADRATVLEGRGWSSSDIAGWAYFDAGSGGSTYTLTMLSGTITLTGQNTTLNFNRVLQPQTGIVSLTGQDAGLNYNRSITFEPGSISLNGDVFGLNYNRQIQLQSGSLSLTGQALELVYNPATGATYTLTLLPGALSLTGSQAGLNHNRVLSPQSGSVTLTGQDTELNYNRVINLQPGSLSLNGESLGLNYNRVMTMGEGALSFTGQSFVLNWSGFVAMRVDGYTCRYELAQVQPTYSQTLITPRYH